MLTRQTQKYKIFPRSLQISRALMHLAVCILLAVTFTPSQTFAFSEERVVAVINGTAVTSSDVSTFTKILKLQPRGKRITQKHGLNEAIETHLKIQESKNRKVIPTDKDVEKHIASIAAGQKKSPDSFYKNLRRKGIDPAIFKKYIHGQLGWNTIIRRDYGKRISIDEAAIQKDYEKIKNNPKPGLRLVQLRNVLLPIEKGASREIVGARIAEAKRIVARFKRCSRLKAITEDIYNVRIGKIQEIPLKAMNPKARSVLRKTGPGKIFINGISPKVGGLQMTAYCGNRTLKAPIPNLKQYTNKVYIDQLLQYSSRHMKKVKDLAIIEIKGN
jgi:parvulin-like peptidyl-prolyl isomerase